MANYRAVGDVYPVISDLVHGDSFHVQDCREKNSYYRHIGDVLKWVSNYDEEFFSAGMVNL